MSVFLKQILILALITQGLNSQAQSIKCDWSKSFGGPSHDMGRAIDVDKDGNVYTAGKFWGTADFDPGPDNYWLSSESGTNSYVQKLDSTGNFLWAKSFGSDSDPYCEAHDIVVDNSGNVIVTGEFMNEIDFQSESGTTIHTGNGDVDIYVLKLDSLGNFLWAHTFGGLQSDYARGVTVDIYDNVYFTGGFRDTVEFDPSLDSLSFVSLGYFDILNLKFDLSGDLIWSHHLGGTNNDYGQTVTTDLAGNVYFGGHFNATVDFDPSGDTLNIIADNAHDVYVQKLDNAGNLVWVKAFGNSLTVYIEDIVVDPFENVYLSGDFDGNLDLDPGPSVYELASPIDERDRYVLKLDPIGDFEWAFSHTAVNVAKRGGMLALDSDRNLYHTGHFYEELDLDPGPITTYYSPTGGTDIFLQKIDPFGNLLALKIIGGTNNEYVMSIQTDQDDKIYLTGSFWQTDVLMPGPCITSLTSSWTDIHVLKFSECALEAEGFNLSPCDSIASQIDQQILTRIELFPNPTSGLLAIEGIDHIIEINVLDLSGSKVMHSPDNSNQIDLSNLPRGLYILKIHHDLGIETAKIVRH